MSDFAKDFMNVVDNRKGSDIADSVGMPDEKDYETLLKIIQKFERKNPGLIKYCLEQGRKDYDLGVHSKKKIWTGKTTVNKDSNMNYIFELPAGLYDAIEAVFPSMFRSKKHFAWFKKNFTRLTIGNDA